MLARGSENCFGFSIEILGMLSCISASLFVKVVSNSKTYIIRVLLVLVVFGFLMDVHGYLRRFRASGASEGWWGLSFSAGDNPGHVLASSRALMERPARILLQSSRPKAWRCRWGFQPCGLGQMISVWRSSGMFFWVFSHRIWGC